MQLGRTATRGSAGGDPELGYQAAVESAEETGEALADARMIFMRRLGGGTGSCVAPYVAQLAREAGSLVVAFATLPFGFEGNAAAHKRRRHSAGLTDRQRSCLLRERSDGDIVAPKQESIRHLRRRTSRSVKAFVPLNGSSGGAYPDRIRYLLAALRSRNGRCLFGFGESDSDNRAHDALTQALKNPLMDRGRMLGTRPGGFMAGGPSMTLSKWKS